MASRSRGDEVGPYRLENKLGRGGNGEVWKVRPADGAADGEFALKILDRGSGGAYARFRDEVAIVEQLKGTPGVLPIIQAHLPEARTKADPAWFLMPVATPLNDWIEDKGLDDVVVCVRSVAQTLAAVALEGVTHRDIKPANLFIREELVEIGDWGLVAFPGKAQVTGSGAKVGSAWYVAPEMLLKGDQDRGPAADVFSLAKSLWVLATGMGYPVQGHQVRTVPGLRLSTYVDHPKAHLLDPLLEACTHPVARSRPSMSEVSSELAAWLSHDVQAVPIEGLAEVARRLSKVSADIEGEREGRLQLQRETTEAASELASLVGGIVESVQSLPAPDGGVYIDSRQEFDRYVVSESLECAGFPFAVVREVPDWGPVATWLWIGTGADIEGGAVRCHVACTVGAEGGTHFEWHSSRILPGPGARAQAEMSALVSELAAALAKALDILVAALE